MSIDLNILEFKSTQLFTLRLVLKSTDFSGIIKNIQKKMQETGSLFEGESIVIDAYGIVQPLPWDKLIATLKEYKLNILGIYTNERLLPSAIEAGLIPIDLGQAHVSKKTSEPAQQVATPPQAPKAEAPAPQSTAMIVDRHLRSGERLYAAGQDLIIIGNVGHGAEVIADGNIHVYGSLLGRAIAGAKGDTQARIFTTHLDPSLVAIAGIYRLFDGDFKPDALQKAVVVTLKNESLSFEQIKS